MRTIAALVAGLLLSTATFFGGLVIALTFLNVGEPEHRLDGQNTAALWPTEPVAVDKVSQSFERLPARPKPKEQDVAALSKAGMGAKAIKSTTETADAATDEQLVDPITTGAIETQEPATDAAPSTWQNASHVQWCSRRYRSYRAEDNSYRPYGGGRRSCQSPYFNVAAADAPADRAEPDDAVTTATEEQPATDEARPQMEQASYDDASSDYVDGDHVESCFARYRSYRPEDNSYQPFDGGPRRQCR